MMDFVFLIVFPFCNEVELVFLLMQNHTITSTADFHST